MNEIIIRPEVMATSIRAKMRMTRDLRKLYPLQSFPTHPRIKHLRLAHLKLVVFNGRNMNAVKEASK